MAITFSFYSVIWDIMRSYCKKNPPLGSKFRKSDENDAATLILSKVIISLFVP